MIKQLHTIAFTHRNLEVGHIGSLHIELEDQAARFGLVKSALDIDELMFLSTCNRVEYFMVTDVAITDQFIVSFFEILYPQMDKETVAFYAQAAVVHSRMESVNHAMRVAASIDSLVVGEREIITQVRQAFEQSRNLGLSGDTLRILMRHTIETAKRVYTETKISLKPVSIVSIAYQRFQLFEVPQDARVLVIGAGVTNTNMLRFLKEYGLRNFAIFNRTVEKAQLLADEVGGVAYALDTLSSYTGGFDVLVTCTGADKSIIDKSLYASLLQGETDEKVTIDLALPSDIDGAVHELFPTKQISIHVLQAIADSHLDERKQEVGQVETIIEEAKDAFRNIAKMRAIEVAMRPVPQMVKDIRAAAFNEVFKQEIESLDPNTKALLEKVVGYMEKKYISMPMLMAKEIMFKS